MLVAMPCARLIVNELSSVAQCDVAILIAVNDEGRLMLHFYRATACNATHGIAVTILSVCPPVRPSVRLSVRQMHAL